MQDKDYNHIFESERRDFFSPVVALVLTVAVHFLLYWIFPKQFAHHSRNSELDELKLEIIPPKIRGEVPKFVEANPYANQDSPRPNAPESFQNQRASDELPDPGSKSKMPYVSGEIKDGKKIVQGTSSPEDILNPQAVHGVLDRPLVQHAHPAESSVGPVSEGGDPEANGRSSDAGSGVDENTRKNDAEFIANSTLDGDDRADTEKVGVPSPGDAAKDGFLDARFGRKSPRGRPSADRGKQVENLELQQHGDNAVKSETSDSKDTKREKPESPQDELPSPRRRPTLSMKIPAGPLADNKQRASSQGFLAVDSRFSEFGAYQQRMIEAISRQWNLLGSKYDLGATVGSQIVIEFSLNMAGELVKCEVLFSNSTNTGAGLCEQAILTTAPYGAWTAEMIGSLGSQDQPVRITFHYR